MCRYQKNSIAENVRHIAENGKIALQHNLGTINNAQYCLKQGAENYEHFANKIAIKSHSSVIQNFVCTTNHIVDEVVDLVGHIIE